MYTVEVIDSLERFNDVRKDWERLYNQKQYSILFSYDYVYTYFQVLHKKFPQARICVFLVKDATGNIVAIFPFNLEERRSLFLLHLKILYVRDFQLLPFYYLLIDTSVDVKNVIETLVGFLKNNKIWDICHWNNIYADAGYFEYIFKEFSKDFLVQTSITETLVIDINTDFQEYLRQNWNKKDIKELKRQYRRLSEFGPVRLVEVSTGEDIEHALAELYKIEDKNWKGRMGTSLQKTHQGLFFEKLIHLSSWDHKVRLFFLQVGSRNIAGLYTIFYRGTCNLLKMGYDESYYRYSPSTVLLYLVFEHLYGEGTVKQINCTGDFYSYEQQFGHTTWKKNKLFIYRKGPRTRFYILYSQLISPFIRKFIDRITNRHVLN